MPIGHVCAKVPWAAGAGHSSGMAPVLRGWTRPVCCRLSRGAIVGWMCRMKWGSLLQGKGDPWWSVQADAGAASPAPAAPCSLPEQAQSPGTLRTPAPRSRCCPCAVPVLSPCCPRPVPALSLFSHDSVAVLSRCCHCAVPVLSLCCLCAVPAWSPCCPGAVPVLSLRCPGVVPVLSPFCPGAVLVAVPVLSRCCPCSLPVLSPCCSGALPVRSLPPPRGDTEQDRALGTRAQAEPTGDPPAAAELDKDKGRVLPRHGAALDAHRGKERLETGGKGAGVAAQRPPCPGDLRVRQGRERIAPTSITSSPATVLGAAI